MEHFRKTHFLRLSRLQSAVCPSGSVPSRIFPRSRVAAEESTPQRCWATMGRNGRGLGFGWTRHRWLPGMCAALLLFGWPMRGNSQTPVATVGTGSNPSALAVNPVTNKVYVANFASNNVTVIDGATNAATAVAAGTNPVAVAVNPLTNQIYVANETSNDVTVINGATNTTTTVMGGTNPVAVAVNPVTNQIYVANQTSNDVTVIDGVTNATTTVAVGTQPVAVAVNPVTNQVYVANGTSNDVTVIDGATNTTTTVAAGTQPVAVAVNPVTNQIYVVDETSNDVAVINGATNTGTMVAVGTQPVALAVNPVTNQIYVANEGSANVTVIDGATNGATSVAVGTNPFAVAVNVVTNQIYVANETSNDMTVIDGATNTTITVTVGTQPVAAAVNPVTNQIYVANEDSANVTAIDGATNITSTVAVGTQPVAVAVNPVTKQIYVANETTNNVSVIDGATNTATTIAVGTQPVAVAVNPVTNQIYVANNGSADVTVIDGATNTTTAVAVGTNPVAVAVNPVTNQIYVANQTSNDITVIDGATNTTAAVAVGTNPVAVAVDTVTNQIYVANQNSANVTVIDGATNTSTLVPAGTNPVAVAVNPVTNKIYVVNETSNDVTVIDGATNTTASVAVGTNPIAVSVNPVTNQIYVANQGSANVTVIDGTTNTTTVVAAGTQPVALAVNAVTNQIYVANQGSANVTVIDGATNTTTAVAAGTNPFALSVNAVTNQIYVDNQTSNDVTVLTQQQVQNIPLTTAISTLPNNQTTNATPSFTFTASSTFSPTATTVDAVYFQVDTWQGAWTPATATTPGNFTGTLPTLSFGLHILYAYATDGQDASLMGGGSSPLIGNIAAYLFLVTTGQPPTITSANNAAFTLGQAGSFILTTTGSPAPGIVESGNLPNGVTFVDNGNGTGTLSGTPGASGVFNITFTAQNGVGSPAMQNFVLTVNKATSTTVLTTSPNPSVLNQSVALTATVSGQFDGTPSGTVKFMGKILLGTVTLQNGQATLNFTFTTTGARSITAIYSGDANFLASTSAPVQQTVNKVPTNTVLASSHNPSNFGQAVSFTATVSSGNGNPPGGEVVTFKDGTTTLGTGTLSGGVAMLTTSALKRGIHNITATYGGDAVLAASTSAVLPQTVSFIQHVIVIFQENRTPDNLFQDPKLIAAGADIAQSGTNSLGQNIPLVPVPLGCDQGNCLTYNPDHSHMPAFVDMFDGGKMDGADKIHTACAKSGTYCLDGKGNYSFAYVQQSDVAPYFQLAETYTFADNMFQSNQGPSLPAHQYLISGSSAPVPPGMQGDNLLVAGNPLGVPGINAQMHTGCTAPADERVQLIDPATGIESKVYPCFDRPTLTDLLNASKLSWKYYAPSPGSIWTAPNAISHMCGPAHSTACTASDWKNHVVLSSTKILTDISTNHLSSVSWVIPTGQASDHPVTTDGSGPSWVASIVNAVGNSPYWANTAIIITWDDWGGWYDHVKPPLLLNQYEIGFRVPMIVVSPYAKPAYISHDFYEFGSILKFIENTFGLNNIAPGATLIYADQFPGTGDLSDCFDFTQPPLPFHTIPAKFNAAHFLNDKRPPTDPDDD